MAGQLAFEWLWRESMSAVAGRWSVFHVAAVLGGLGTMLAIDFGWAVPRFGVVWGPLVALVAGLLAYWLSFVAAFALGGCVMGLALHFRWYLPPEEEQERPPSRADGADAEPQG